LNSNGPAATPGGAARTELEFSVVPFAINGCMTDKQQSTLTFYIIAAAIGVLVDVVHCSLAARI
jgi:hypothetical protein